MSRTHGIIHGRNCVFVDGRWFAVRREKCTTDRLHSLSRTRGEYDRQMQIPGIKVRNTRSIKG